MVTGLLDFVHAAVVDPKVMIVLLLFDHLGQADPGRG